MALVVVSGLLSVSLSIARSSSSGVQWGRRNAKRRNRMRTLTSKLGSVSTYQSSKTADTSQLRENLRQIICDFKQL